MHLETDCRANLWLHFLISWSNITHDLVGKFNSPHIESIVVEGVDWSEKREQRIEMEESRFPQNDEYASERKKSKNVAGCAHQVFSKLFMRAMN